MSNQSVISKTLKAILIVLLGCSILLNFYQSKIIEESNTSAEYLINYKKAYIKLIEALGVSEEQSQQLLKSVEQKTKTSP